MGPNLSLRLRLALCWLLYTRRAACGLGAHCSRHNSLARPCARSISSFRLTASPANARVDNLMVRALTSALPPCRENEPAPQHGTPKPPEAIVVNTINFNEIEGIHGTRSQLRHLDCFQWITAKTTLNSRELVRNGLASRIGSGAPAHLSEAADHPVQSKSDRLERVSELDSPSARMSIKAMMCHEVNKLHVYEVADFSATPLAKSLVKPGLQEPETEVEQGGGQHGA